MTTTPHLTRPAELSPFDLAERDRRWERIRVAMDSWGVDLLVLLPESSSVDVHYVAQETGAVLFPLEGDPTIVLGGEDSHLAVERDGWIGQRSSATPLGSNRVPYGAVVAERLAGLGLRPRRVAVAGLDGDRWSHVRSADGYTLFATMTRIVEALEPGVDVVNGSPIMGQARYVKSEAELAVLRASVAIGELALEAIGDVFQIGRPQADSYRAGMAAMLRPGVTLAQLAWCPGLWGRARPRLVAPPAGSIDRGLCVATEVFPYVGSYVGQVAQPFVAGEPTPQQQEVLRLGLQAFEATCRALRPGATWREVEAAALAVAEGTPWRVNLVLHGGLDGPLLVPGDTHDDILEDEVQADTVFVCKPLVFPTAQGHYVGRSHDMTWGDTVVVRAGGAERLGSRPQEVRFCA